MAPMQLDACIINTKITAGPDRVIQRLQPDFTLLKDFSSPTRNRNEIQDVSTAPPEGVYLHWILPPGLRRAMSVTTDTKMTGEVTSKSEFPSLPDRWLVIRHYGPAAKRSTQAWVIESNYIDEKKGTTPFPDPEFPNSDSTGQTRIGRAILLSDWQENSENFPKSYLPKLDALSQGDIHFSLHQPYCDNVFSFIDDFSDLKSSGGPSSSSVIQPNLLSYFVAGWYSKNDPLEKCATGSIENFKNLLERFQWQLPDNKTDVANRVICHGMVCGVNWDPAKSPIDPASDFKTQNLQVAMGSNALDALTALLSSQRSSVIPRQLLEAFHTGLLHKLETSEGYEEIQQDIHQTQFGRHSGGTFWTVSAEDDKDSDDSKSILGLTTDQAKELNQLNKLQQQVNIQTRFLQRMQWDFYGVWWKINRARFENINFGNQVEASELFLQASIDNFDSDWPHHNAVILIRDSKSTNDDIVGYFFDYGAGKLMTKKNSSDNLTVTLKYSGLSTEIQNLIQKNLPDINDESANLLDNTNFNAQSLLKQVMINLPVPPDPEILRKKINDQRERLEKLKIDLKTTKDALTSILLKEKKRLKPLNQSPFWFPQDPVVLIAGLKSPSWDAVNSGSLSCRFQDQVINGIRLGSDEKDNKLTVANFTLPEIPVDFKKLAGIRIDTPIERLWQEFFLLDPINADSLSSTSKITIPKLREIMSRSQGNPQSYSGDLPAHGLRPWNNQPWFPLLSKWKMQWQSIPFEYWRFDGEQYHLQTSDLSSLPKSTSTFEGRSFFVPQANFVLKGMLSYLLDQHPNLKEEFKDWQTTLDAIDKLDLLSFSLSGLHGYLTQCDLQMNRTPHVNSNEEKDIAEAVGGEAGRAPLLLSSHPGSFEPVCHGQFYLDSLQVIDRFGQSCHVIPEHTPLEPAPPEPAIFVSQYLSPPSSPGGRPYGIFDTVNPFNIIQLGPRIVQNSRLDAEWLTTDKEPTPLSLSCQSNPISAWILPNYFNQSLQAFDPRGDYLGELTTEEDEKRRICVWAAAPSQPSNNWEKYPYLCDIVKFLINKSAVAFEMLREIIENALITKTASTADYSHSLAAVAGRFLGLARAQWSVELEQPAYLDQNWQNFSATQYQYDPTDPTSFVRYTPSTMDSFQFPVQLGNTHLNEDGLIGYFQGSDYSKLYSHYYMPEMATSGYVFPIDEKNGRLILKPLNPGVHESIITTLLFDPFTKIHAHSDILPLKILQLPGVFRQQALHQISLHLRVGPILTVRSSAPSVALLQPSVKGAWSWLDPENKADDGKGSSQSYLAEIPLRPADAKAHFHQPASEIIEGLLKFSTVFTDVKSSGAVPEVKKPALKRSFAPNPRILKPENKEDKYPVNPPVTKPASQPKPNLNFYFETAGNRIKEHIARTADEKISFTEYEVTGDGNCGFTALGVRRSEVVQLLWTLVEKVEVRTDIVLEELIGATALFKSSSGAESDPTQFMEQKCRTRFNLWYDELVIRRNSLDNQMKKIRQSLQALGREFAGGNTDENILMALKEDKLGVDKAQQENCIRAQKNLEEKRHQLRDDKEIFMNYIRSYDQNGRGLWLGAKSMYWVAKIKGIGFKLWGLNSSKTELRVLPPSLEEQKSGNGSVDLIIKGGHYNFLVEESCSLLMQPIKTSDKPASELDLTNRIFAPNTTSVTGKPPGGPLDLLFG